MTLAELIELTDSFTDELVPIAGDGPDVCPVCRSGKAASDTLCSGCDVTMEQVNYPCTTVLPVSYYTTPSPLRERMHDYKEHDDARVRGEQSVAVCGILARHLHEHGAALATRFGSYDEIVAVPSTKSPPGSALARALGDNFAELVPAPTNRLAIGPGYMDFRQASPTGFIADEAVASRTVLLIDDTFTTGARLQSAAHALQEKGATVVAAVIVCRKINPDPRYYTDGIWERQSKIPFSYTADPWWADQ